MRVTRSIGVLVVAASLFLAACQSSASESPSASEAASGSAAPSQVTYEPATVSLQLQWTDQAQFAGYYAAVEQGYYDDVALTVNILPGGGTIVPQQVGSAPDGPEFTIAWMPKVLEAREAGLTSSTWPRSSSAPPPCRWRGPDSGITQVSDWAGKKIGAWPFGNELEVLASAKILADLVEPTDFTRVEQDFDMNELIAAQDGCAATDSDCVNVAEAMIYNEWAQLLEATDPTPVTCSSRSSSSCSTTTSSAPPCCRTGCGPGSRGWTRGTTTEVAPALPRGLVPGLDVLPRQSR